jgi:hypothetical protein
MLEQIHTVSGMDYHKKKFDDIRSKPSRYKLSSPRNGVSRINCNLDPHHPDQGYMTWYCLINTMSNWSACEEIARLETIGRIQDIEPEYEFHRDNCTNIDSKDYECTSKNENNLLVIINNVMTYYILWR